MNEAETRAEHIDPALAAAGWGVIDGSRIRREYPITLGRIEGHSVAIVQENESFQQRQLVDRLRWGLQNLPP